MNKPFQSDMPAKRRKARHYAVQALYQWELAGQNLKEIEAQFKADNDFSVVDLEYFHALLHEIPAQLPELEESFIPFLDRKTDALDPIELTLLRIGSFELLKRIDVPYKVAINEAVNLAKKFGATESHRYINGILDKVAQAHRQLETAAEKSR